MLRRLAVGIIIVVVLGLTLLGLGMFKDLRELDWPKNSKAESAAAKRLLYKLGVPSAAYKVLHMSRDTNMIVLELTNASPRIKAPMIHLRTVKGCKIYNFGAHGDGWVYGTFLAGKQWRIGTAGDSWSSINSLCDHMR